MDGSEPTNAVPIWERVLRKCWTPDCPKLATVGDWAGWWWCDDHKANLQDGRATETVTWESACQDIRRAMENPFS